MVVSSTAKPNTMRATKTKTSCTKPAGGIKRSCQDRAQPDVGTPKAMKDPNWRTRQDTGSSTDIENVMPPTEQPTSKLYPQATSFHSGHTSQDERTSSDHSFVDKYSSESSTVPGNFVKILRKIDLKPLDGRQMSIFELDMRPETPTPSIASDDRQYAKVSRNAPSHQRNSSSATQVTGSSQSADNIQTPDLFHVVTLDRLCRQSCSVASSHSQLHESRNIYERDQDTGNSFESTGSVARNRAPVDGPLQSPQTAIRDSRDRAFQRLIQRLNRDSHPTAAQATRSPMKTKTTQKPSEPAFTNMLATTFRRPMEGGGRRNQTISDFKVDYWEHGQSSMTSRDGSEDTVQKPNKQNTWNPKAREFFSLGHQQNSRRPLPWGTGISVSHEKPSTSAAWSKTNTQPFNPYPPAQDQEGVHNGTVDSPVGPFCPIYNLGLAPETFGPTQFLPGGSAPQPPLFAVPPFPGIQPPIIPFGDFSAQQAAAQQVAAQQVAAQQMAALPYLASLASLGRLPPLLSGLEKPSFATNTRRPPVPKPTLPNAGAQLAYEEWIEWRKAHEPGYAVECKARQQRRTQRGKGPKDGSGDKPAESRLPLVRAVVAA